MNIISPLLLLACPAALADTIKLIDGTIYEDCKILFTQGEEIVIEYPDPTTPSIKKETRIKEYDILKHIKSTPADNEFKRIMRKGAKLDTLTPQDSENTLKAIAQFLQKTPAYPQAAKLEELADTLRNTVRTQTAASADAPEPTSSAPSGTASAATAPDAPLPTKTAADKERFAYDCEADRLYSAMQEHIRANRNVEAMQMFTLLEKFRGSAAYVKAYPEAGRIASVLQSQWTRQLDGLRKTQKERKRQMEHMSPQKQEEAAKYLSKLRRDQQTVSDSLADEAKKQKWSWYTPPEDNMPATESALHLAQTASERLSRPLAQSTNRPGEITPLLLAFWQQIDNGSTSQARETLKKIDTAGMPPAYLAPLEQALKQKQQTPSAPVSQP